MLIQYYLLLKKKKHVGKSPLENTVVGSWILKILSYGM